MAGYREFQTGEVLTAANVNSFLMEQATMTFADAAARDAALFGVLREGLLTYNLDTNRLEVYDGTDWIEPAPEPPAGIGSNVVSVTKTDTFSQGSVAGGASVEVTGLSVTITPTSATSKVLLLVSLNGSNSDSNIFGSTGIRVMRGATRLAPADVDNRPGHTSGNLQSTSFGTGIGHVSVALVDSPETTSPTTYSVEVVNMASVSGTVHVNRSALDADAVNSLRTNSSITAIEVAA